MIKKIYDIYSFIKLYVQAYIILYVNSILNGVKSFFTKDKVIFEMPYEGQKVLLLALYTKYIRADIEILLREAKQQGLYIVAVNAGRININQLEQYSMLFDCYIERYNYGRDFGSYKTGLMYIIKKGIHFKCPRLLILNDSVFYSRRHLAPFIGNLVNTDFEVLSATENHEINHHLGSFCISLNNSIINNAKFIKYWKKYRNSDLRPIVVRWGEMELSNILKRCVSSVQNIQVLYDVVWLSQQLDDDTFLNHVYNYKLTWPPRYGPESSLKQILKRIYELYGFQYNNDTSEQHLHLETNNKSFFVNDLEELVTFIVNDIEYESPSKLKEKVFNEARFDLLRYFAQGSQIHNSNSILHYGGLPIIKLDLIYRGVFSFQDIEMLAKQLEPEQMEEFKKLVYSKQTGLHSLVGWRLMAFRKGLI